MPDGKPAGVPCIQLDSTLRCRLYAMPERPAVCSGLRPEPSMCGNDRAAALDWLSRLERLTRPILGGTICRSADKEVAVIEHTGVGVSDYARSKAFYQAALAPLGYELGMEFGEEAAGFRADGHTEFWIESGGANTPAVHVAFRAGSRESVQQFYRAALAAGGKDNGPPGLREDYSPDYYAAFVRDPDGHNIEAVCFTAT